jgi:hypothetical protein
MLPPGEGRRGARMAESESLPGSQRSGGVTGQGLPRFMAQRLWCCLVPENPSPRLFRAECFGADSLHAGLRAPEPTLSRGERVAPVRFTRAVLASRPPTLPIFRQRVAPVRFTRWVLASRPPTLPIFRAEGGSTVNSAWIIHAAVHQPAHRDPPECLRSERSKAFRGAIPTVARRNVRLR